MKLMSLNCVENLNYLLLGERLLKMKVVQYGSLNLSLFNIHG